MSISNIEGGIETSLTIPTAEELRRVRKILSITQKELAERAGVSQSLVARIEAGKVDPRLSTLTKLINALTPPTQRRASDIMRTPVISVEATDSVREVVDLMERHGISQMPVNREGKVVGSIQEATIIRVVSQSREPGKIFNTPINSLVEEPFPEVGPDANLEDFLGLFSPEKGAILVTEQGVIKGIISKIDMIAAIRPRLPLR